VEKKAGGLEKTEEMRIWERREEEEVEKEKEEMRKEKETRNLEWDGRGLRSGN